MEMVKIYVHQHLKFKGVIMTKKRRVLSLFSGCGGMDIGFEGGFRCLKRSVNRVICTKSG